MNVLSLFDGMSCGQQALERAGITVDNYFASEIDKYAMHVTMANYPDTKQLGSVVNVNGADLPKIDLLIGGSPCQSFSFAGKRKGMSTKCETEILTLEHYLELKSDGYEFEGQSYLFWEFMRLLNECKPKYFLLENVEMGEKWEKVLSKAIGVNGIHINSALVSAQNRKRIYWTNIGMESAGLFGYLVSIIRKPKDKKILLKDVLESEVDEKYYLSEKIMTGFLRHNKRHIEEKNQTGFNWKPTTGNKKAACLRSNPALCAKDNSVIVHNTMPRSSTTGKGGTGPLSRTDGKTYCLDTGNTNAVEIVGLTEVRTEEAKKIRKETGTNPKRAKELIERTDGKIGAILTAQTPDNLVMIAKRGRQNENGEWVQQFEQNNTGKTNTITTVQKDNLVAIMLGRSASWGMPENGEGKSYTLCKEQPHGVKENSRIRRLTPLECERLQTVKDNYTNHVSDSQRYKMLGNGWTVDVIAHIFKYIDNGI